MLRLIKRKLAHLADALLWDEQAAVRWLRGLWLWLAAFTMSVITTTLPFLDDKNIAGLVKEVRTWSHADWIWRAAAGVVFSIPGMIAAGQKNRSIDDIHQALVERGMWTSPMPPVIPPVIPPASTPASTPPPAA